MTREQALELVLEAAQSWANELAEYIIPADDDIDPNRPNEIYAAVNLLQKGDA